jgi:hypothetical protein
MDEELIGERHQLGDAEIVACDFCGRPFERKFLKPMYRDRYGSEATDFLMVCESCAQSIESGEVTFDAEIAAATEEA